MQALNRLLNRGNGEAEPAEPITPEVVTGTLMACKGTKRITRQELSLIPTPPATDTFKPISHATLINEVEKSLSYRHISIESMDIAVSNDGMKLFSLLVLNADHEGVRFAIGLRNANDRSMRVGLVAGYQVTVCSNMMFRGEFHPMLAKHSKNFDLIESVSMGIDRIQRQWDPLKDAIEFKRNYKLNGVEAQALIYRAFMQEKFPVKLMRTVHSEFFIKPSYDEFKEPTVFSLENAFTTAFKALKPEQQYRSTTKLGKFLAPYSQAF